MEHELFTSLMNENKKLRGIITRKNREIKQLQKQMMIEKSKADKENVDLLEQKYERGLTTIDRSKRYT